LITGKTIAFDKNHPMYDRLIDGSTRPLLSPNEKLRYTWIFENRMVRSGILSQYQRTLEINWK
jgi:hypothetical protein